MGGFITSECFQRLKNNIAATTVTLRFMTGLQSIKETCPRAWRPAILNLGKKIHMGRGEINNRYLHLPFICLFCISRYNSKDLLID